MMDKKEMVFKNSILPNPNEVFYSQPLERCIQEYLLNEVIKKKENGYEIITKKTRNIKICFSGIENNLRRYQVLCMELVIENNYMGLAIERIVRKHQNVFDEVIMYVNNNGSILEIINIDEIQERWEETKKELKEQNQGIDFENYLAENDDFFDDPERILKYISSKVMYGLYFNDCWGFHDLKKPRYKDLKLILDEPREMHDRHTLHLAKPYSHDSKMIWNTETDEKTQLCEMIFKNNQLEHALLEINEPNKLTNYSLLCLTL